MAASSGGPSLCPVAPAKFSNSYLKRVTFSLFPFQQFSDFFVKLQIGHFVWNS